MNSHFNFNAMYLDHYYGRNGGGNNHGWRVSALLACWYNNDPAHVVRLHVHLPIYGVRCLIIRIPWVYILIKVNAPVASIIMVFMFSCDGLLA
jgi:hypothetical protein